MGRKRAMCVGSVTVLFGLLPLFSWSAAAGNPKNGRTLLTSIAWLAMDPRGKETGPAARR